jgi:hypothetical protein
LLLALYVGLSCQPDPTSIPMRPNSVSKEGQAYKLMRRALRTLVAINLDVTWIALRSRVRSPVAAGPRRNCSARTELVKVHQNIFSHNQEIAHRVRVMRSVLGSSSDMVNACRWCGNGLRRVSIYISRMQSERCAM